MSELVMTKELKHLEFRLDYLEGRKRTAIFGFEARFYQGMIENTQTLIERAVDAQINPQPIEDAPGDFMGC